MAARLRKQVASLMPAYTALPLQRTLIPLAALPHFIAQRQAWRAGMKFDPTSRERSSRQHDKRAAVLLGSDGMKHVSNGAYVVQSSQQASKLHAVSVPDASCSCGGIGGSTPPCATM